MRDSGSWEFATVFDKVPSLEKKITWNGNPLFYRTGTSDVSVIHAILLKKGKRSEYYLDTKNYNPSIILDIGGNIGVTAIYYASLYPKSKIYTIEPVPDNYRLLLKNIAPYKNIVPFNFALGAKNGTFPLYYSNDISNQGGYSLYTGREQVSNQTAHIVQVKDIKEFIQEHALNNIDIVKIDTEGAEYDILTAIPSNIIENIKWIIGELHSNKDEELIQYLTHWFQIYSGKGKYGTICPLYANNKNNL